ncbi:MAG: dephospho-CoA kinase [Thiobacillaceae bacterium]|jgi:dephospho-CoA kinase|nr:dephospho-CoA kinase [Thiobacillaceae bacterium]
MLKIGLTGGIGSGKTSVADIFSELGVPVIDTDVIARQLTALDGAALPAIRAVWGESVMRPDGELDRVALRRRIFADPEERRQLEAILHPLIRRQVVAALAELDAPYVVVVIPLLVETGSYRELLDRVLVVDSPESLQVERVRARSGLSAEEVSAIISAQADRASRIAAADDIIANDADRGSLRDQVLSLDAKYREIAGRTS